MQRVGGWFRRAVRSASAHDSEIARHEAERRRLLSIIGHAADAIVTKDTDGTITEWNRAAELLYGYSREEAVGRSISLIIPAERAHEGHELLTRALAGETVSQHETIRRHRDGSLIHVSITVSPLRDEGGDAIGAAVIARDITRSKELERDRERALGDLARAQRAAKATAELFRNALENAPIGMALVDPSGRWLQVNRALCDIVGFAEDELLGLTFEDITHPEDLGSDAEHVRALLAGEIHDYQVEKRYRHKCGQSVWVQLSVSLVRDEDAAPRHFIAQIQDITSERAARRALAESERRYESIAANVPGMVFRFLQRPDGTTALPFVSAAARDIYELEPEQVMADPSLIFSRVHPEDRAAARESIASAAAGLTRWECHSRHVMADGRIKHLGAIAAPIRNRDGSITWDGVITDETAVRVAQAAERETGLRLQAILENLPGSAVTLYDREHRLRMCEGPLFANLDVPTLIGQPLSALSSTHTAETVSPAIEAALAGEASTLVIDHDRRGRTLAVRAVPYPMADGSIGGALVHWHDISSVRQAERARDEAQDRFRVAFERAPIGMAIISDEGHLLRVNQAYCDITGYPAEELLTMEPFALVHPDDAAAARGAFAELGREADTVTTEGRVAHMSRLYRWTQSRVTVIRDADGRPLHALAQVLDITERRAYEQRLEHLADHDPLTGLLNRRGFECALERHLAQAGTGTGTGTGTGALLLLDLDGFKRVNDTLGHAAGDDLLIRCGAALAGRLRETDTVARLGGDEFAVLLPNENARTAEQVARSLIATVREATTGLPAGDAPVVTVSIGVALSRRASEPGEELLARADLAMYAAKAGGRDRYAMYDAGRDAAVDAPQSARDRHATAVS